MLAAVGVPATLCHRALHAQARCRRASCATVAKKKEMAVLLMVAALATAVGIVAMLGGSCAGVAPLRPLCHLI